MRVLLPLAVFLVLAGCVDRDPERTSSPSPTTKPRANLTDNAAWANLTGDYYLYRMHVVVERFDNATQTWGPHQDRCTVLQRYSLDAANETLYLPEDTVFHPSDPGLLVAVWIYDVEYGRDCKPQENGPVNGFPTHRAQDLLPNSQGPGLVLNATFVASGSPAGFDLVLNDIRHAGDATENQTLETTVADVHFRARIDLLPVDWWPLNRIRRY